MYQFKTRTVQEGYRWCVECLVCGRWQRYPHRFGTRSEARAAQFWVAQV